MTRLKRPSWSSIIWMGWSVLLIATFFVGMGEDNTVYGTALGVVFALVTVLAIELIRREVSTNRKLAFLNFAVLSAMGGVAWPFYNRFLHVPLSKVYPTLYYYLYLYLSIFYFFWLNLSVLYLIICVTTEADARKGYVSAFVFTLAICLLLYYPYIQDTRYLVKRPDVVDYRLVEKTVRSLKEEGDTTVSISSISAKVELFHHLPNGAKLELFGSQKESRIAYLLTYLRNNWLEGLVYAPLFRQFGYHGFFLAFLLVLSSAWWYFKSPPTSAYLEKIAWVLVPYCLLEGFHNFSFESVTNWESLEPLLAIGVYFSVALLIGLAILFGLRLRFIQTVEGDYYERRLLSDPSRITRWRDSFDTWVLREFMNPGELDRRFLTQHRTQE